MVSDHAQIGTTYAGLFPEWGTTVNGQLQKVHLIGHSMGGTTIRMLTQILNEGVANAPIAEDPASSELFRGGKDWVHSVTTISTPNQGTTLSDMFLNRKDLIDWLAGGALGFAGSLSFVRALWAKNKCLSAYDQYKNTFSAARKAETITAAGDKLISDFSKCADDNKMSQWAPTSKETIQGYVLRVSSSKDNAAYSLSTAGANAQNAWVQTLPHVYYYSFVSHSTLSLWPKKYAMPKPLITTPYLAPFSILMGTHRMGFDESWLQNDGAVNVPSQASDGAPPLTYNGQSKRGAWMKSMTLAMDHIHTMGSRKEFPVYDIYRNHLRVLLDLPCHEGQGRRRFLRGSEDEGHQAPDSLVRDVLAAQMVVSLEAREPIDVSTELMYRYNSK